MRIQGKINIYYLLGLLDKWDRLWPFRRSIYDGINLSSHFASISAGER